MRRAVRKNCVICKNLIPRTSRAGRNDWVTKRKPTTVTCNKVCSRTYARVSEHVRSIYVNRVKVLERRIKRLEDEEAY